MSDLTFDMEADSISSKLNNVDDTNLKTVAEEKKPAKTNR